MTSHLNQDCVENLFSRISRLHCIKICYNISRARSKTSDFCIFERTTSPWINALSKGGLVVPSEDFVSKVYHLEKIFQSVHGSEVLSECNVIKKLANLYIRAVPSVPSEVLKKFAKTRTFIRLKYLNCKLKFHQGESVARRKRKQLEQFRR